MNYTIHFKKLAGIIPDKDLGVVSVSSQDPTEVTVLQAAAGVPTSFLLRKTRKAISGEIKTTTFPFGNCSWGCNI